MRIHKLERSWVHQSGTLFFVSLAALVDFANLVTKKVSLLVCGHVVQVRRKQTQKSRVARSAKQ